MIGENLLQYIEDFISVEHQEGRAFQTHEITALTKLYVGCEYAIKVVAGEKVAGKLLIAACQRFINDFDRIDEETFRFNCDAALKVLKFYAVCICHVKGKLEGKPIDLMDWHSFILINLFGWQIPQYEMDEESGDFVTDEHGKTIPVFNEDGSRSWVRRFRTAYVEVARKNAKSTLSSGIGLYLTAFDNEGGAEVYSAATTKDQARIVFDDSKAMIRKNKVLNKVFGHHKLNIHHINSGSKFEPLSSDADTLDGKNIHGALVDELHAHKTRDVWDVLETATGAREQSLIMGITTAGFILDGICYEIRDYCKKILTGTGIEDDSFFGVIYTIDEDDDPFDESVWFKSNPGLGICKKWDDLRRLAKKAKEQISAKPNFLTKHLNVWVRGSQTWLRMDKWNDQECKSEDSDGVTYIGVDLSQKIDICAAIKANVKPNNDIYLSGKFWIPEGRLETCSRQQAELYQKWANEGYLELTDGDVIDQEDIRSDLKEWLHGDRLEEFAFDPWSATQFALDMIKDGFPMIEVPQTVKNLSEAMKQTEAMIYKGEIFHDGNPVMTWMMANVCVKPDKNGNIFPLKEKAENKIDGPVALFTAMSRAILREADRKGLDWYDEEEEILSF